MIYLRRVAPNRQFYTGAVIEISGPRDNRFILWPEEKWGWEEADGKGGGGFMHEKNILDFRQENSGGAISYRLDVGPEGCETLVRVIPGEDAADLTIPVDRETRIRLCARQGAESVSRDFALYPGAARRCVLPLGRLTDSDEALDLIIEPADGKAALAQMDCLSAF